MTNRWRILVTGGAGFIGSALCRYLIRQGHNVVNVDKLTYSGNLASLYGITGAANYCFVRADSATSARCAGRWPHTPSMP